VEDGTAGGAPCHQVVDVQQRAERRAHRLDLPGIVFVQELPPPAVRGVGQHLRARAGRVQPRGDSCRRVCAGLEAAHRSTAIRSAELVSAHVAGASVGRMRLGMQMQHCVLSIDTTCDHRQHVDGGQDAKHKARPLSKQHVIRSTLPVPVLHGAAGL